MKSDTIIQSVAATEVIVPAKPGTLNSETVYDTDNSFAKKFLTGESWTDFAVQPKWIIEMKLKNGLVGIGETYRSVNKMRLENFMNEFTGKNILKLNWRRLPVSDKRLYDTFEMAVLDLAGKISGVPVYQLLGGKYKDAVECMGWTGRRTPEDAARLAFKAMKKGHRVFKFKCSDEDPVRLWTKEIKKVCGTGIKILLDPNQRWNDVGTTMRLMEGVDKDIMFGLEDPVKHEDLQGFIYLKKNLGIPVYRHISLPYSQDIRDMILFVKHDAADGYNFNGSAYESVLLSEIAHLEGKACWRGSEVDLGILEAMALHIAAASVNCTIPSDIFGELVREDDLIEQPLIFENGAAVVPTGPGLGVNLDHNTLQKFATGNIIIKTSNG